MAKTLIIVAMEEFVIIIIKTIIKWLIGRIVWRKKKKRKIKQINKQT